MKLISIILSSAILFAGCYANTTVTKDTPNLDNEEITVTLADGLFIISEGGQHHRVDNGYKIVGEMRTMPKDHWSEYYQRCDTLFHGVVLDEQIKEITCREFDVITTVIVVGLPLLLAIVVMGNWTWGAY
jgi:hypothetical protein